jgi:hypothetical protein
MAKNTLLLNEDREDTETYTFEPEVETKQQTSYEQKSAEFINAMRDLGNEGKVIVKRQHGTGKEPMAEVDSFEPDEYDYSELIHHLRANYGGGLYRIYLRKSGRNVTNTLVRIAEPLAAKSTAAPASQAGEIGALLKMMMDRQDQQSRDMIALLQNNQNGGADRTAMMQEMLLMKQVFSNDAPKSNNDPLALLKGVMDLQSGLGLGAPEPQEAGFADLLEKVTPLIQTATNSQPPQPNPAERPQPTDEQRKAHSMHLKLKMGLGLLMNAAKSSKDPGDFVTMITTALPDSTIKEFILAPDSLTKMTALKPEIAEHSTWFLLLGEHIKAQMGLPSAVSSEYDDAESQNIVDVGVNDGAEKVVNPGSETPTDATIQPTDNT